MADSTSGRHIQLHNFTIRTPLPLPILLHHPSRLALKFSINGVSEVLSARACGDTESGIWEIDGNVKICEDQLLTATILVFVEDSTKELGTVTTSYSQLLAHVEARAEECYGFTVDGSVSSAPILVICSIKPSVPLPQEQSDPTEPVSPGKSESDEECINSNRDLVPDAPFASDVADLESLYARAANLPAERKSLVLDTVACAYKVIYDMTYKMGYLERAISIIVEAVQTASSHPKLPGYLNSLTVWLIERFRRTGNHDDIEHAISRSQDVVRIVEIGDPNRHHYILHHANALLGRFECLGNLDDLQTAISFMNTAMELVPNDHPDKAVCFNNLGNAFQRRFDWLGRLDDMEIAIAHKQKAVDLTPDDDPDKPGCLNNLGNAFHMRFNRLGQVKDLEAAIEYNQKAVDLTPDGHPDKPTYLNNLGNASQTRFDRLGRVEDLETAIAHKQKAVDLTPGGHPDKPSHLNSLGNAFNRRFGRLGRLEDLEIAIAHNQKAVDLTFDNHPHKPLYLNSLGGTFTTRFDRSGHVEDLETAIAYDQKAVDLTSDGHPRKPGRLENLGTAFQTRFNLLGHVEDLEIAITHQQKAVDLTPDDHPDKPGRLDYLGNALEIRFDWLGHVKDLERAIVPKRKAVDLTPNGHPDKPLYLSNLGVAFETRFCRLGHVKDLETAIVHQQKAVDLMPDGHPNKPGCLFNLGAALERRSGQLNRSEDLETAIAHNQKAVDLTPDDHPHKPGNLNSLGRVLRVRFDRLGRVEDLEMAITHTQMAIDMTPDGHPDKPEYLNNLGYAFDRQFGRLGRIEDLKTALIQFSTSASLSTGNLRVRLLAARNWASASEALESFGVFMPSSLGPYRVVMDLLPRVAWLGIPISTQHALLQEIGGDVRNAVAAAIKVWEYDIAVGWAEAGRSVTWQNLLHLRTPATKLRNAHCDLADKLEAISRQLQMSVRGSDDRINGATCGMKKVSRSHVQLALDWDNTVADIRSKPGFGDFLKPKSFDQLGNIGRDGPVVMLNISEGQCYAIILGPDDMRYTSGFSMPGFSYEKSEALLKELKRLLRSRNLRGRDARPMKRKSRGNKGISNLADILRCLWIDIAKPIIEALAYHPRSTDLPHIWWCTAGPLAFLPIHAAGIYDTDEPGSKLSDYVVSSYAPTLSTLLNDSPSSQKDFTLLAIAQANAPGASPIPKTEVEVKKIQTLAKNINMTTIMKEDATIENVWRAMEKSNWVHLACHGQQNTEEPLKSGLLLHDGTLELQRLIEKPLPLGEFAFLSACQTATGDESVAEESLHLAAGMLFAGYKGVIATMWSIMDDVGPQVAEDVYREMLKDGKPNRKAAAHALHKAVKRLREDPKVDMLHWVPFIHIGL